VIKIKKKRFDKWDITLFSMIGVSLFTMGFTYLIRTSSGIESWYSTPLWVYLLNEISEKLLLGLIMAYAVKVFAKASRGK